MTPAQAEMKSKVPRATFLFWIIKIMATTLGETGGDAVSMSLGLGYLKSTLIFAGFFAIAVFFQLRTQRCVAAIYWVTLVATTTVGTTLADLADRSFGIGYAGGVCVLSSLLAGSLFFWRWSLGSIASSSIHSKKAEIFYWITILFSQTLGTALGDWTADSAGFGYAGSTLLFAGALAFLGGMSIFKNVSRTFLFWSAFILTRPLGASLGDFLDKPLSEGGLALSRYSASGVLIVGMVGLLFVFRRNTSSGSDAPKAKKKSRPVS